MRKLLCSALLACSLLAGADFPRVRLGGVTVGAGYTHFSGPYYYPAYYHPWFGSPYYAPFYYSYAPFFYHPFYGSGFARGPNMGEIKLQTVQKSAEVYLDGAYAGTAGDLKTMWLEPGAYNLEVRADGASFQRRVYVLSGKTLRIQPKFVAEDKP